MWTRRRRTVKASISIDNLADCDKLWPMTEAEKDFIRSRIFGDVYDLHNDFRDADGNRFDIARFAEAAKQGFDCALKELGYQPEM